MLFCWQSKACQQSLRLLWLPKPDGQKPISPFRHATSENGTKLKYGHRPRMSTSKGVADLQTTVFARLNDVAVGEFRPLLLSLV